MSKGEAKPIRLGHPVQGGQKKVSATNRGCLPAPFEEQHSSWGLEKPWLCGVCLQLHHSLFFPGEA